ncbi:MAG: rhodanese-like domain-containing protein [Bauldia sp.]|uniref:rhodanese-like domain-containing protein n=1 Tax=Bauldia sp. TaxID=2575872 RepID=UPI001D2E3F0C|nr:rhodanese-like domain-containing protein [Bauldia sp.]MCB1496471.1 rhodanese-like domain-containing protein [Bauldia sp.]
MSSSMDVGYAGDVSAKAAWESLAASADAILVDVRTRAEWTYVGVPVLSGIDKETLFVAWNDFDTGARVPDFLGRLTAAVAAAEGGKDSPIYFLCRSGARSRNAAITATEAGYARCYNVEHGFEGDLGPDGHRATAGSWKAEGLPWAQS